MFDKEDVLFGKKHHKPDFDSGWDEDDMWSDPEDKWSPDEVDDMIDWCRDSELMNEKWIWVDDKEDEEEPYSLVGQDGNIFALMSVVSKWMRTEKCDREEINHFIKEVQSKTSYEDALSVCIEYTDMCNKLHSGSKEK